ncbi:MAG: hypothetical protein F6J93_12570 [Oscillatoria sp. SIO1A7]|nr:hypothetical protein [Oscillatoria sp. SIO1A7]
MGIGHVRIGHWALGIHSGQRSAVSSKLKAQSSRAFLGIGHWTKTQNSKFKITMRTCPMRTCPMPNANMPNAPMPNANMPNAPFI